MPPVVVAHVAQVAARAAVGIHPAALPPHLPPRAQGLPVPPLDGDGRLHLRGSPGELVEELGPLRLLPRALALRVVPVKKLPTVEEPASFSCHPLGRKNPSGWTLGRLRRNTRRTALRAIRVGEAVAYRAGTPRS